MHPTLTQLPTPQLTPTPEQVADAYTYLTRLGLHGARLDAFTKGYLSSVVKDLATGIGSIEGLTPALAMIAAVEQLDTETTALTDREDPESGLPVPAGVEGIPIGRYAR